MHGDTKNPRDPGITPGGSSGGAGAAVAAGIGHIAHGTDIAGSIRYPAYACGVHGLRPTLGRIAAFNAALPERTIGPQICAVSGPLARTIGDLTDRAGGDVGLGRARSLVGAGAAGRAGDAEARRAVPQSRWARSRAGSEGRGRGCRQAAGARGLDGRGDREHAAAARGRRPANQAVARRRLRGATGMPPNAKAIPARSPACAATRPRCFRSMRPLLEGADAARDVDARMAAVLREICRCC